jgi:hypothetical protein
VPLNGVDKGGYKLVWKEEPNPYDKGRFGMSKSLSLAYSLGFTSTRTARSPAHCGTARPLTQGSSMAPR